MSDPTAMEAEQNQPITTTNMPASTTTEAEPEALFTASEISNPATLVEADPQKPVSGGRAGDEQTLGTKAMGMGAKVLQDFSPLKQICRHLCGFHCYSHDVTRQVEAHHYCSHLSEDMLQCVIYDSPDADARLIGVEYIISAKLYVDLPEEEKVYWHSHEYEVKGGVLTVPMKAFVPAAMHKELENTELSKVINTYGKTWHLWQVDRGDVLPFGPPSLMMSFIEDGQIDPKLLERRDKRERVTTAELRERRQHIEPAPHPPSTQHKLYAEGMAWQAKMEKVPLQK